MEAYDPLTNTWTSKAAMPTARSALAAGVVNGLVYAVGGADDTTIFPTVEVYDAVANAWTAGVPMPTTRAHLGVGVVNNVLYAIGGGNSSGVLSTNEAFTPTPPAPVLPTTAAQCRSGGWKTFGVFKNQGDCVSFVATKGRNPPAH
jgi:hypothetical protein